MKCVPLEKKYLVASVRVESAEITTMEILDESSKGAIKTAVFRLSTDDFEALGSPNVRSKLKITLEVEKPSQ